MLPTSETPPASGPASQLCAGPELPHFNPDRSLSKGRGMLRAKGLVLAQHWAKHLFLLRHLSRWCVIRTCITVTPVTILFSALLKNPFLGEQRGSPLSQHASHLRWRGVLQPWRRYNTEKASRCLSCCYAVTSVAASKHLLPIIYGALLIGVITISRSPALCGSMVPLAAHFHCPPSFPVPTSQLYLEQLLHYYISLPFAPSTPSNLLSTAAWQANIVSHRGVSPHG